MVGKPSFDVNESRFELHLSNIENLAKYKNTKQTVNFDKQKHKECKLDEPERTYCPKYIYPHVS